MGSSQDSLGSWDERLQLATAMSEVTEADFSVLHEVHERMLDSQREEVQRRREGLAVSEAAAAVSVPSYTLLIGRKTVQRPHQSAPKYSNMLAAGRRRCWGGRWRRAACLARASSLRSPGRCPAARRGRCSLARARSR